MKKIGLIGRVSAKFVIVLSSVFYFSSAYSFMFIQRNVESEVVDRGELLQTLNNETDIENIRSILWRIPYHSKGIARDVLESKDFDMEGLLQKIKAEPEILKVATCMSGIAKVSENTALDFIPAVIQKINNEKNLINISICIGSIAVSSKRVARELFPAMARKLNDEPDLWRIYEGVKELASSHWFFAEELIEYEGFDKEMLIQKINDEPEIRKIGRCIGLLAVIQKEVTDKKKKAPPFPPPPPPPE